VRYNLLVNKLTSIAFTLDSPDQIRERLRAMTDDELIKFGREVRKLAEPRVIPVPDPWKMRLDLVREEWRRRHPKT
jgi:hypothetical protein